MRRVAPLRTPEERGQHVVAFAACTCGWTVVRPDEESAASAATDHVLMHGARGV